MRISVSWQEENLKIMIDMQKGAFIRSFFYVYISFLAISSVLLLMSVKAKSSKKIGHITGENLKMMCPMNFLWYFAFLQTLKSLKILINKGLLRSLFEAGLTATVIPTMVEIQCQNYTLLKHQEREKIERDFRPAQ